MRLPLQTRPLVKQEGRAIFRPDFLREAPRRMKDLRRPDLRKEVHRSQREKLRPEDSRLGKAWAKNGRAKKKGVL